MDLRSALARGSEWTGVEFVDPRLDLADFSGSTFEDVSFDRASGLGLQLGGATLRRVRFFGCKLDQALFVGAALDDVTFLDCELPYSNFAGAGVGNASFIHCNLHGADLDFIQNDECGFDDCNLWGAKASLGCAFFNSDFDGRTCDRFTAMLARIHPDPEKRAILEGVAGKELAVVKRLMDRRIPEEGSWPKPEESVVEGVPV